MSDFSRRLKTNLRNRMLGGILVVVPVAATLILLRFLFVTVDGFLAPILERTLNYRVPGLGILITLVAVYVVGALTANVLGRRALSAGERVLKRVPLVRGIYNSSKLLVQSIASSGDSQFSRVVLLEYPRRGIWTVAFVTNEEAHRSSSGEPLLALFVPTTPNPTSGVMILAPETEVGMTDFTIEEGVKLVVSGGILSPRHGAVDGRGLPLEP